jgi:hypothetical protein
MNIYIDIETLRGSKEHKKQLLEDTKANFKAPSTLTKTQAAKDLGITDSKEIKFTTAGDMIKRWETELAEEKSELVANEKWEKTSLDPNFAPIACICIGWYEDETYKTAAFNQSEFTNEAEMLEEFNFTVNNICSRHGAQIHKPFFIGHNIARFDLPFIWKRSIINNVKTCAGVKWIGAKHDQHCFDTMIAWAGFCSKISADNLCEILNIKGKTNGMCGSLVYDEWQKNPQKVIDYCADDVTLVKNLHERMTGVKNG